MLKKLGTTGIDEANEEKQVIVTERMDFTAHIEQVNNVNEERVKETADLNREN